MPDLRRFVRETAGASYYREQPLEILRFARSKAIFARYRSSPDAIIAALGFEVLASRAGLDRWAKPLGEMVERIDRVNREETDQGAMALDGALLVYSIVRSLEPELVIETGVAVGVSTAFDRCRTARERSRELDLGGSAPDRRDGRRWNPVRLGEPEVGWAIPDQIRHELGDRHELVLEDVRTALPRLLDDHGTVDFFLHDDLHTPAHMAWEYDLVWPVLSPGGVLMSDDVNHAWLAFAAQHGLDAVAAANISRLRPCASQRRRALPTGNHVIWRSLVLIIGLVAVGCASTGSGSNGEEASRQTASTQVPPVPDDTIMIAPDADAAEVVAAADPGAHFVFAPGVHRSVSLIPRDGDAYSAAPRAVLSGAVVVDGFVSDDRGWVVEVDVEPLDPYGECRDGTERCGLPEEIWVDGEVIERVGSADDVDDDSWWFDPTGPSVLLGLRSRRSPGRAQCHHQRVSWRGP